MVTDAMKAIWIHHFGSRLVMGKHYGTEVGNIVDERLKIIKSDQHVAGKVVELYEKWRSLGGGGRRPDRAMKSNFLGKQEQLCLYLDLPLDIRKLKAENIIQHSGIMDWREEIKYLRNQMTRDQIGCLGSQDTWQKKRDEWRMMAENAKEVEVKNSKEPMEMTDDDNEELIHETKKKQKMRTL